MPDEPKRPVINCHTHIFTGGHVPPYLAKAFVPWPFFYLFPVSKFVALFRWWFKGPYTWQFKPWYKNTKESFYKIKILAKRYWVIGVLAFIIGTWLFLHTIFFVNDWLSLFAEPNKTLKEQSSGIREWMNTYNLLWTPDGNFGKVVLVFFFLLFFQTGRNLFFFLLKKTWSFLGVLPGPKTKELAGRYLNIGRFAFYQQQAKVFGRLRNQYPEGTGFVILPMDMEYMDAGKLKAGSHYRDQMAELKVIKQDDDYRDRFFPFVFADPRRIRKEGPSQFAYRIEGGTIKLEKCFIQEYIEDAKFNGFKIYPALGYYPFDEALLPLWKYAAENEIPILSHCIRGTIFYRGTKETQWDAHPVFNQADGKGEYVKLKLLETENKDFCNNFTHPLNYLCLLEETLLRQLVGKATDQRIRDMFGYTDKETPMTSDLSKLKLCFGHFGGDDEWNRFLEYDRDNYSSQLVKYPTHGITFLTDNQGKPSPGKPEQLWKFGDWYSIICSLMLQCDNVYADLSYILHSPSIQPLLKHTLSNNDLRKRVLFGTDFYVVRNHKSEKNMLADMIDGLTEEEFEQIARTNPRDFLYTKLHGAVKI
jgi:predicted TIM-barrel fold metal-dependent hydrolase